jgi:hypothetical protein
MDPIERIVSIQESLQSVINDLEALKDDLSGEAPVKTSANTMDVLSHMKDIVQNTRGGLAA